MDTARHLAPLAGALMILIAHGSHQMGRMDSRSADRDTFNAAGWIILAYIAFYPTIKNQR
jgi:hypothetical protein